MSEPSVPPVRRRILRRLFLWFCLFSLVALSLLGWYVTTDSFQRWMRRRVIAELEIATGGRVELGELHTIPFRLRVDARNLIIHGHEAPAEAPLLQVERLQAEMKIISLLSTTIGLHSLDLEHPVVHLIDYPDGSTNIPGPKIKYSMDRGPIEEMIAISVSRVGVEKGEVIWDNRKIPFSFAGRDVALHLNYSLLHQQYNARLEVGGVKSRWQQSREFEWRAEARAVLAKGRADITSLHVKSGKSEINFAGHLQDFRDPRITGDYRGTGDLGELGVLLGQAPMRKGIVQFAGKGSWSLRDFSTQGTIQARDIEWTQGKVAVRNGRVESAYAITPSRLRLTSIKAGLLGGSLSGEVDVANWQSTLEPESKKHRVIGRVAPESLQRGTVRFQLSGFPLAPELALASSKNLSLDRLNFAGSVSGTVDLLWVGSVREAEARVKLSVSDPARLEPGETPLHGDVEGVYHAASDELELSTLRLNTPSSEITASGSLAATSALRFSLISHNVKEWTPLLDAAWGTPRLPFSVHGWANVTGNASGRLSQITFSGNVEVYDFETELPESLRGRTRTIHWDALSTSLQYSNGNFAARNGSLIHGHTVAHFDLSLGLDAGVLAEDGPFTLHADLLNADIVEVATLAEVGRPVAGNLGLSVNASGMRSDPHGDGHFEVRGGSAYGIDFNLLHGDLRLSGRELQLNNVEASIGAAQFSGSGSIETSTRQFRVNASGHNLDLASFSHLQSSRFRTGGIVDFTAQASGTISQPSVEAHIHVKDFALNNQRAGDFYADAVTQGRQLDLKAHSNFENADLSVQGSVRMENDFPADLRLDFHRLDIVSLLSAYLPGKITGRSPVEGTAELRGPLRNSREIKAKAELRSFSAEVEHVQVASVEPIRFEVTDQTLLIESFHMSGSGTDFTAHGQAHLTGEQEIDLGLDGSVNLTLLDSLNPKILARGNLGLNLSATGTLKDPILQGRVDVKNTFISHNDFPSGLSDLNGVLMFDRNRIQIQNLSGTTGGGTIALSGSANYENGTVQLDLGATARGVRLRYPPGVSSTANADLRLTGSSTAALLSGDVVITKLAVTPGFDFGAYIEKSKQSVAFARTDSLANRLRVDVHVVTTPELQMQTAIARLSGNADLRVRGTADRPAILGRVEVLEGEISFNGTKYRLERGDVTFTNPAKTQPIIDLQAATRVRDYDITVRFRGDLSVANNVKVTWQSEPQLPEADVIALLALGRTREEAASAQSGTFGFGGEASNLLINEALNTAVSSRVQRLFGVSRIKIDPQGLANETNVVRGPQLTIEQQVASNLTVTYSTNVSVSTQQIIQVEYHITRNISIVALRDQNGVVSFDFRIRRRRK